MTKKVCVCVRSSTGCSSGMSARCGPLSGSLGQVSPDISRTRTLELENFILHRPKTSVKTLQLVLAKLLMNQNKTTKQNKTNKQKEIKQKRARARELLNFERSKMQGRQYRRGYRLSQLWKAEKSAWFRLRIKMQCTEFWGFYSGCPMSQTRGSKSGSVTPRRGGDKKTRQP